jgi:uncharacterized membrane protein
MASGVPQGSVLGQIIYILYISDLPTTPNTIMGALADDTAISASHHDITIAASYIQEHLDQFQQWMNKLLVTVNEAKSTHVIFQLKRGDSPTVRINNIDIPQKSTVRYLGLHLDNKLYWREHIQKKKQ